MKAWLKHLPALLGLLLLGGAVYVVQNEFRNLKLSDIEKALSDIPAAKLWTAFGWTLVAYALLTVYDRLGTIYAGRPVSYARAAFASFTAYTLAHNLGFAAVSGAAVRYRLYAQWGLTPLQIGKVVAFCSLTFGLGGMVLGGIVLIIEPHAIPVIGERLPRWLSIALGVLLWTTTAAYITLSRLVGTVRLFGHEVELPGFRMAVAQTLLATVDVAATAAIFHALLPDAPGLTFLLFLGIYVAAYTAGLAANVPGGIGVFDTAMLLGLAPFHEAPVIVGAIVVFRLYYYIVPLFLAGFLFAGNEVLLRGRGAMSGSPRLKGVQTMARWTQPDFEVATNVGAVALCGALLLGLGAMDPGGNFSWLVRDLVPDWLERIFHPASAFVPSLIGAALLVLSVALTRRVTLAWTLAIVLLLLGALSTAMRGEHLWIPGVLLASAALLAPFRRLYYRHARLLSGRLDMPGIAAPLALAACILILASFEPRLAELGESSWWQIVLSPLVPEGVRLAVLAAVVIALVAIWGLVRPGRVTLQPWTEEARSRHAALGGTPPAEADGLLWGESGRAALPVRRAGRVLLALGDPVGGTADRVSAIWRLRDLALQEGLDPAVWRAGPSLLPVYADIGLAALPLGPDGMPMATNPDLPGPPARAYLACVAERDLAALIPLLPGLARETAGPGPA
jgi:uncharacterized membrane protein YbhN (UPF0104 family)